MKNKYIAYLHSCGLSQRELCTIFSKENSPKDFYMNLSIKNLERYIGKNKRIEGIVKKYKNLGEDNINRLLKELKVKIIVMQDREYPQSLKNISNSPYVLYVRGNIPSEDMFGVVGSRKVSSYGKKVIFDIIPDLSSVFPIVSGGAMGTDTCVHKACIESGNKTVVVIGTGIDVTYPYCNKSFFEDIILKSGALISVFPLGEVGKPYNFPIRNEIVVGLCKGILIVEAAERSGSLITAGLSLDLGKDLFSIPGSIYSDLSKGTNTLLRKGEAKCVTKSIDILEEYEMLVKKTFIDKSNLDMEEGEKTIYELITREAMSVDDLSLELSLPTVDIVMKVSLLELKMVIKKDISGKYTLV